MNIYELFFEQGTKDNADGDNKLREKLLVEMINNKNNFLHKYEKHNKYNEIKKIIDNLYNILNEQCNEYDELKAERKGSKQDHYDMIITFKKKNKKIKELKVEYKHGTTDFKGTPQFLQVSGKQFIDGIKIDEYHYNTNFIHCLALFDESFNIPTKQTYGTIVYKLGKFTNGSILEKLHELKKSGKYVEEFKEFNRLSNKSIELYLNKLKCKGDDEEDISHEELANNNIPKLDIGDISNTLTNTQKDKVFLFFKNGIFYVDVIDKNELIIIGIDKIKNNNTIVLNTKKTDTQIEMLLRWKNHIGILNLAWQIKLVRS